MCASQRVGRRRRRRGARTTRGVLTRFRKSILYVCVRALVCVYVCVCGTLYLSRPLKPSQHHPNDVAVGVAVVADVFFDFDARCSPHFCCGRSIVTQSSSLSVRRMRVSVCVSVRVELRIPTLVAQSAPGLCETYVRKCSTYATHSHTRQQHSNTSVVARPTSPTRMRILMCASLCVSLTNDGTVMFSCVNVCLCLIGSECFVDLVTADA